MAKFTPGDDGRIVDGKLVVFLRPGRPGGDGSSSAGAGAADQGASAAGDDARGSSSAGQSGAGAGTSAAGSGASGAGIASAAGPRGSAPAGLRAGGAAGETRKPAAVPRLTNPEWLESHDENSVAYHHQGQAKMRVKADQLDGRRVRFAVEHQAATGWVPLTSAEATVSGGFAVAELTALHPGAGQAAAGELEPSQLRFRAWLA